MKRTATASRTMVSAGLLLFRRREGRRQLLLVHPGGPYWQRKEAGAWTIPKGEAAPGEDLLACARREFEEELGVPAEGDFIPLGFIKQKGGKTVHAWALAGDLPEDVPLRSNLFELEWPPRSGQIASFPEIDRAEFFDEAQAREKINPAQAVFLDRLGEALPDERR